MNAVCCLLAQSLLSCAAHVRRHCCGHTRSVPDNGAQTHIAPHLPVCAARRAAHVRVAGNADNFVPSANSWQGLFFTLNVSGPHGLPSDDEVVLRLYRLNAGGGRTEVFFDTSRGTGEALRSINIQPQASPGGLIGWYGEFTRTGFREGCMHAVSLTWCDGGCWAVSIHCLSIDSQSTTAIACHRCMRSTQCAT